MAKLEPCRHIVAWAYRVPYVLTWDEHNKGAQEVLTRKPGELYMARQVFKYSASIQYK